MTGAAAANSRGRPRARCPMCRRPTVARFMPFCSRRCADEDLMRWLDGRYVIPGDEPVKLPPDDGDDTAS